MRPYESLHPQLILFIFYRASSIVPRMLYVANSASSFDACERPPRGRPHEQMLIVILPISRHNCTTLWPLLAAAAKQFYFRRTNSNQHTIICRAR